MRSSPALSRLAATLALALFAAACEGTSPAPLEPTAGPEASAHARSAQDDLLRSVRQATARFHSTTQAVRAGYAADYDHCVAVPGLGGMGYHWANPALVDGVFDPAKPEVMLYARGPEGGFRLVAVEYIVLAPAGEELDGAARPHFGEQPFDIGGTPTPVPHWSLHVWLYQDNPSGMFAPFNPTVSCS